MKRINIKISNKRAVSEFGHRPKSNAVACPEFEVDESSLCGLARYLAENIGTTWNGDDASLVIVHADRTQREIDRQLMDAGTFPTSYLMKCKTLEEYHNKISSVYGIDCLDTDTSFRFQWGQMHDNESPVDFFKRVANEIIAQGVSVVKAGINRNSWENPARRIQ